jgi:hypothetical protein
MNRTIVMFEESFVWWWIFSQCKKVEPILKFQLAHGDFVTNKQTWISLNKKSFEFDGWFHNVKKATNLIMNVQLG